MLYRGASQTREKEMNHPLIISDPKIMLGKPVIRGRRITVEFIMEEIEAGVARGRKREEIITSLKQSYQLRDEEIEAAIAFAKERDQNEKFN